MQNREKQEVYNILRALRWIDTNYAKEQLSEKLILTLHGMVMQKLSADSGKLRTEPSAIFNQAGIAIYMTPPPLEISKLLQELITMSGKKEHVGIKAGKIHFAFEKIHPFIDGNGRVGRLISTFLVKSAGYDFRGLSVLEEYLNDNRDLYYSALSQTNPDITEFVEFFSAAIAESAERVIELLQNTKEERPEDTLLPRRREILEVIRDHENASFDFIHRRFFKVAKSSLHYDIKCLMQKGFIRKLGTTRGVLYKAKE